MRGRSVIPHLTPTLSAGKGRERGKQPLSVYIHWPFCRSKCPYCDFNSHVRERVDARGWTNALIADLDRQVRLAPQHEVVSIFFGGGTPSLMPPETAAALIERVKRHWNKTFVTGDPGVAFATRSRSEESEHGANSKAAKIIG
jgi:coproporphyrinogen III oxidase-like Fe-S oxidoreductase